MASNYINTSELQSKYTTQQSGVQKQTTETASTKLSQDYSTFLTMLTTQLQNQDPLNPLDNALADGFKPVHPAAGRVFER